MPRLAERHQALQALDHAIESGIFVYLIESLSSKGDLEDIEELLIIQESIASLWSLSRAESAGRYDGDSLEAYIDTYNESAFRSMFRMHRASFWQLVELLTNPSGAQYWDQTEAAPEDAAPAGAAPVARPHKSIYQQVAVGLYILGGGTTMAKSRVTMNIAKGST